MRILEYKQDLFENGYTVVGGDMHYHFLFEERCRPIKITNIIDGKPTDFVENLIESVDKDWDDDDERERFLLANYADIMRGKYPTWRLVSFNIIVGYVCLRYYDFETGKADFLQIGGKDNFFDIQFDVERGDDGSMERYLVSIDSYSGKQDTKVTEYVNHVRREIEFYFKDPSKNNPFVDAQYITVTEYANL